MLTTYLSHLFCAAALLKSAYSQKSVPADLSVGFDPSSISMQAAYGGGEASEGFADGTKFTKAGTLFTRHLSSLLSRTPV